MKTPDWVTKFKEPKTEIKFIKGGYYKYAVSYKYNPERKRTDKITGVLLGKITQEEGFVPSDKNRLRNKIQSTDVDIRNYGLSRLFFDLVKEEKGKMEAFFPKEVCELLFSFALYRWGYNAPIKRAPYYYGHDFCARDFIKKAITDKHISEALKTVGEQRTTVVEWMKTLLNNQKELEKAEFVMMDSTHVSSKSELLTVNAKGYNPNFDFDKQIRLMYLFSAQTKQPVYYRLINGNITDLKSMTLCVEEMHLNNVIYIADKGFYSKANIEMMKQNELQYIIPLHRNNNLIDFKPLQKEDFKTKLTYFIYQNRIIWHYSNQHENNKYITFLDEGLRAKEESDYVSRIITHPESYTEEKFVKKLSGFGTLTFTYNIRATKSPEEIYIAYKQRNEIEIIFDAYKNFLEADLMYMQNRYVVEGWLTANFIAMMAYHKLYIRLKDKKKLSKYAPKDIIEFSKSIYMLKINGKWRQSELTQKLNNLFKLIGIDYLN